MEKEDASFLNSLYWTLFNYFSISVLLPDRSWITYRGGMIFLVSCSILLVALVVSPNFGIENYFPNRLFDYIGKRSYGIYLWQIPVLVFNGNSIRTWNILLFLSLVLIIGLSELSLDLLEVPLRRINYCKLFCKIKNVISKNGFQKIKFESMLYASLVAISMAIVFLSPKFR